MYISRNDCKTYWGMLSPAVITLVLITIIPMVFILYTSMSDWNLIDRSSPLFLGFRFLKNYRELFKDENFWHALYVTVVFTIASLVIEVILGVILALLFNREFKGWTVMRSFLLIPMMSTPAVIGLAWRILYNPQFGIINYFLSLFNINGPCWLSNPKLALFSIILVDVWEWTPFMALSTLAALQIMPKEQIESAKIDGADTFSLLRYIILPMILPVILISASFRLGSLLRWFDTFYTMTSGGPGRVTENLGLYLWRTGFYYFNVSYAAACAVVLIIVTVILTYIFVKASKIEKPKEV